MSNVMIEAKELSKTYGSFKALKKASFEVRRGEVLGFLGPNGAGKTTTMKILTCFIAPTDGTAVVNGSDVFEDSLGVRRSIGYLPEHTPLYTEMLVAEYLEFMAKMRGFRGAEIGKRVKKVVDETNLGDRLGMEIRALSKGYRQRVGLAQALIHEPPILILDEPMSGLDPNQATGVRDLIREIGRDRTVILSTHNLAEVQVTCDRVLIVSGGAIVADDTPDHLSARAGKSRFVATVRAEGADLGAVQRTLEKVDGAASVAQKVGDADGEIRFELVPKGGEDLRADIFRAAVDGGFVLLGLEKHGEDLESIFRDLTTGPEADKEAKAA